VSIEQGLGLRQHDIFNLLTFLHFSHHCGDFEASYSHVYVYVYVCMYAIIRPSCGIDLDTLVGRFHSLSAVTGSSSALVHTRVWFLIPGTHGKRHIHIVSGHVVRTILCCIFLRTLLNCYFTEPVVTDEPAEQGKMLQLRCCNRVIDRQNNHNVIETVKQILECQMMHLI
jgi:hypothetical protein